MKIYYSCQACGCDLESVKHSNNEIQILPCDACMSDERKKGYRKGIEGGAYVGYVETKNQEIK